TWGIPPAVRREPWGIPPNGTSLRRARSLRSGWPPNARPLPSETAVPTLLIVEDEEILGKNIRRALEKLGHAVSLAPTCGDAERLFGELNPDLTLMDLRLPDGSGLDLLARLRAQSPS